LIEDFGFEIFKTNDIKVEMDFMKELVLSAESPIVFTHLDYRSSNLMITKTKGNSNEENIVVCDYDTSRYDYRGRDFAIFLREWNRKAFNFKSIDGFPPEDSNIKQLAEIYLKECEQIFGKKFTQNRINSLEHIIKEIKIFSLNNLFYSSLMFIDKSIGNIIFEKKVSLV